MPPPKVEGPWGSLWKSGQMTIEAKGSGWLQYYNVFQMQRANGTHVLTVSVYAWDSLMLKIDKIPAWSKKVGTKSLP